MKELLKSFFKKKFNVKNILLSLLAIILCVPFSFMVFFMGVVTGATRANSERTLDSDSWQYVAEEWSALAMLTLGAFLLPLITLVGLIIYWRDLRPTLAQVMMFCAPITVLFFTFLGQGISAVFLALRVAGIL